MTRKIHSIGLHVKQRNAYHAIGLHITWSDGETEIIESPITYGYGDQSYETMYAELEKRGYVEPRRQYDNIHKEEPFAALRRQDILYFIL